MSEMPSELKTIVFSGARPEQMRQWLLKKAIAPYVSLLKKLEWGLEKVGGYDMWVCPSCGEFGKGDGEGHAPDCELANLLKESE